MNMSGDVCQSKRSLQMLIQVVAHSNNKIRPTWALPGLAHAVQVILDRLAREQRVDELTESGLGLPKSLVLTGFANLSGLLHEGRNDSFRVEEPSEMTRVLRETVETRSFAAAKHDIGSMVWHGTASIAPIADPGWIEVKGAGDA